MTRKLEEKCQVLAVWDGEVKLVQWRQRPKERDRKLAKSWPSRRRGDLDSSQSDAVNVLAQVRVLENRTATVESKFLEIEHTARPIQVHGREEVEELASNAQEKQAAGKARRLAVFAASAGSACQHQQATRR